LPEIPSRASASNAEADLTISAFLESTATTFSISTSFWPLARFINRKTMRVRRARKDSPKQYHAIHGSQNVDGPASIVSEKELRIQGIRFPTDGNDVSMGKYYICPSEVCFFLEAGSNSTMLQVL
jgi:hypothetical protein